MGKRINLTKTDLFLLGLTVLFLLAVALTWLLTPRTARGDYEIEAEQPTEDAAQLRIVDCRKENCPFTDAAHMLEVDGIGQTVLESIQDFIVTEDTQE